MGFGRKLTNGLYRWARITNDVTTLMTFSPYKIARRLVNKFLGRKLVKKAWFKGSR